MTLLLASAMLWIAPYRWPSTNHAQEALPILARLHPGLFSRDFAVQSFLGPSPRIASELLVLGGLKSGASLPVTYFVLQTLSLIGVAAAVVRIARWLSGTFDTGWTEIGTAAVLGLWVSASNHHGWNLPIVDPGVSAPSTFAMPFALWGWYSGLRGRWRSAYVLFGLAAVLQFLVGLWSGLLLAPIALNDLRRGSPTTPPAKLAAGVAVWLVCLASVALPILAVRPTGSSESLVRIFGYVRAPHHWIPSSGGGLHWLNQLMLGWAAFALGRRLAPWYQNRRIAAVCAAALVIATIALGVNYLGVEIFRVAAIAKLQAQRAMPFAHLAILTVCAAMWRQLVRERRYLEAVVLLFLPLARADGFGLALLATGMRVRATSRKTAGTIIVIAAGGLVLATLPIPDRLPIPPGLLLGVAVIGIVSVARELSRRGLQLDQSRVLAGGALAGIAATALACGIAPRLPRSGSLGMIAAHLPRIENVNVVTPDVRALSATLHEVAGPGALVLLPPVAELEFVPLLSERSSVFTWKNIPYDDAGIAEWGSRLETMIGRRMNHKPTDGELRQSWIARTPADLLILARRYGADFIVSRDEWHPGMQGTRVTEVDGWSIWRTGASSAPFPRR